MCNVINARRMPRAAAGSAAADLTRRIDTPSLKPDPPGEIILLATVELQLEDEARRLERPMKGMEGRHVRPFPPVVMDGVELVAKVGEPVG